MIQRAESVLDVGTLADVGFLGLTVEDPKHLDEMNKKIQALRDYVIGVAIGFYTGRYVFGPGGTSKSYTILETLNAIDANYILHNSRLTGQPLFNVIAQAPDSIHVLEDTRRCSPRVTPVACCAPRSGGSVLMAAAGRWSGG